MLFIPSYLTVILYRVFASPSDDGNLILMAGTYIHTLTDYSSRVLILSSPRHPALALST